MTTSERQPREGAHIEVDSAILRLTREHRPIKTERRPLYDGDPWPREVPQPLTELWAALLVERQAAGIAREAARRARGRGASWAGIAAELEVTEDDDDRSPAEVAFDWAAGESLPAPRRTQRSWERPTVGWTCTSCDGHISDTGPYAGEAPDDLEHGHRNDCSRLTAARAEWHRRWEDEL